MLAVQQERTGLADVLVKWLDWKTDLLRKMRRTEHGCRRRSAEDELVMFDPLGHT